MTTAGDGRCVQGRLDEPLGWIASPSLAGSSAKSKPGAAKPAGTRLGCRVVRRLPAVMSLLFVALILGACGGDEQAVGGLRRRHLDEEPRGGRLHGRGGGHGGASGNGGPLRHRLRLGLRAGLHGDGQGPRSARPHPSRERRDGAAVRQRRRREGSLRRAGRRNRQPQARRQRDLHVRRRRERHAVAEATAGDRRRAGVHVASLRTQTRARPSAASAARPHSGSRSARTGSPRRPNHG